METIEKISLDFDDQGRPKHLHVVGGGELLEQYSRCINEIEADPNLASQFRELMARKWEEYRDRESHRKLVD